ncbi:uncharacterized protein DUF3108 [Hoeflea marina]|uniref:Uncharacterized protein DUF3108 n=1 Tax=Hoeflea marina TaxID=274592 RepID=A0A317PG39_9HYPH|nr:DUF3108 domain-containing protein [Hoeflea marina]PWV98112.1 uncharacterized protein DUF3108 [Hoeflea marina]
MRYAFISRLAVAAMAVGLAQLPATADTIENRTSYSVTLLGLPIADLDFTTVVKGKEYQISGRMRTSALADIFEKTRGTAEVKGRIGTDRLVASRFAFSYTSGRKTHSTEMRMRNGNVQSTVRLPEEKKRRGANWVPLADSHMRSVLDPLSSLIIPATGPVCPRTLPIFDGESRMDLVLGMKGVRPFSTKGFSGDVVVCSVRIVPKGGYRKGNDSLEYLRKLTTMEVWFAKNADKGYYAPVYAKVPTKIGQVTVSATLF